MVNQIRIWRPNDLQTAFAQTQAKLHVVEIDREIDFIEAAKIDKHFLAQDHARCRHAGIILLEKRAIKITGMSARNHVIDLTGYAAQPDNDATMLHSAGWIPKTRADRADFRSHRVASHFAQPTRFFCFDIVIEQC